MITEYLAHATTIFSNVTDGIPDTYEPQEDLETTIASWSLRVVGYASITIIVLLLLAWKLNDKVPKIKTPLFIAIAATILLPTIGMIGSTVYLNVKSESGGPVHWHADFEIWACGNELELRDPVGFSNKIGTSTLHEHDDHRIHLEGVAVDKVVDASLGKYMYVIGGAVTDDALIVPLNPKDGGPTFEDEFDGDGQSDMYPGYVDPYIKDTDEYGRYAKFISGQTCNGQEAEVQTFVYNYDEETDTYKQTKLTRPQDYVIYEDPNVPPGDCIIMEFDIPKSKTDKLCEQYGVRDIDRCEEFGVEPDQRSICTLKQVDYDYNADYLEVNVPAEVEIDACGFESTSDNYQLYSADDCPELINGGSDDNPDLYTEDESTEGATSNSEVENL